MSIDFIADTSEMKFVYFFLCAALLASPLLADKVDDDFAEFEDFDVDEDFVQVPTPDKDIEPSSTQASERSTAGRGDDFYDNEDNDGIVEEEDSEFEHFSDEEEFEGFSRSDAPTPPVDQKTGEPKLTMAKVPLHFRYVCRSPSTPFVD